MNTGGDVPGLTPAEADLPLGRLLGGFGNRWSKKTAVTWRAPSQHMERAREGAADFADRPAELAACIEGFFATQDRFAIDKRWPFKLFLNDPARWLDEPATTGRMRPARHDADAETEITDDLFVRKEAADA